jgi:hypothetical protein
MGTRKQTEIAARRTAIGSRELRVDHMARFSFTGAVRPAARQLGMPDKRNLTPGDGRVAE